MSAKVWSFDDSRRCVKCQGSDLSRKLEVEQGRETLHIICRVCGGKYVTNTWESEQCKKTKKKK